MTYILNPAIALRGWRLVPRAYYIRGNATARGLKQEEFDILCQCDGETELPDSHLLDSLLDCGLCVKAENGENLTEWQRFRHCDNRYFPAVNWAVTGKCNFNCRHCFNAADNTPLMSEFSWEQCQDFIRQLDECGVQNVTLTGGEPMLHPHFMDICREVDRRGMVIDEVTTNGSLITPEMLDELAAFKSSPTFKLSFDGVGHHDWFRMKDGAQRDVLEKTKLLRDKDFRVRWQTNVYKDNMDAMLPTAKLADEMGIESIRVIRTSEAPRWAEMGGELCLGVKEYYDFALDFTRAYLEADLKPTVDIWQAFLFRPKTKSYHHRPIEGGVNSYRDSLPVCRGARGRIAVTPEGDVVPCNQLSGVFKKLGICIGNVHKTLLRELLNDSEFLQTVCLTVGELREENPKCQICPHWKLCMGGCRALAMVLGNGNYIGYDPAKCIYFDEYFDKFATVFGEGWYCEDDL